MKAFCFHWCHIGICLGTLVFMVVVPGCRDRRVEGVLSCQLRECCMATHDYNVSAISNCVAEIVQNDDKEREEMVSRLVSSIVYVKLAETSEVNGPCSVWYAYDELVSTTAGIVRDRFPPQIVVGMLIDAYSRMQHERTSVAERTFQWRELVPSSYCVDTNDFRFKKMTVEMQQKVLLASKQSELARTEILAKNNLHNFDCMVEDFKDFIERKAIPYFTVKNKDANMVENIRERFRACFGHEPRKRAMRW